MLKKLKNYFILICVVYTMITFISSLVYLIVGETHDTYFHLVNRFIVTTIGVGAIFIYDVFKKWPSYFALLIDYGITMSLVFAYVWFTGFFEELHPDAYRDIFLNFTAMFIFISISVTIYEQINKKKKNIGN